MTRVCAATAALALVGSIIAASPAGEGQSSVAQGASARAESGLVQVPVFVRDRDGQPVRGLPSDAFAVFEAGRPMPLVGVQEIRRDPSDASYVPREIVLVVDDLNTRPEVMPRAIAAALDLLERADPRDRIALVNTSSQPSLRVDFTTTRSPLRQALARVRGQHLADGGFAWWRGRQALTVLRGLLDRLRQDAPGSWPVPLVLFTEGYGIGPAEQSGMVERSLLEEVRTVVGLAARAHVAVYAIDPTGLEVGGGPFRSTGSRQVGPVASMRRAGMPVSSSLRVPDDPSALGAIAHDTGGHLTRWTNDLLGKVQGLLTDADEFYLLTYEMPGLAERDRRPPAPHVRQIDVRVHRPDLYVRAPQGYVHPRALE